MSLPTDGYTPSESYSLLIDTYEDNSPDPPFMVGGVFGLSITDGSPQQALWESFAVTVAEWYLTQPGVIGYRITRTYTGSKEVAEEPVFED